MEQLSSVSFLRVWQRDRYPLKEDYFPQFTHWVIPRKEDIVVDKVVKTDVKEQH